MNTNADTSIDAVASRLSRAITFLFVPGNRPDRFASAWSSKADVVVLDLEASVHPDSKSTARVEVARWLPSAPDHVTALVRLNRPGTEDVARDIEALAVLRGFGLMCSGAELGADIDRLLLEAQGKLPVVLLVETALGVEQANQLAALPGVCRLAFGNMDYATELNLGPEHWGLIYPSSRIVVASRCAKLPPPIAGVTANIRDRDAVTREGGFERSLGFGAKMCIHPGQLEWARQVFEPTDEEREWARRILEATANSHAVSVDGQMIDRPVIERASRILERARARTS